MLFEVEVSPKLRQSEVLRRHMDLAKYVLIRNESQDSLQVAQQVS